MMIQRILSSKNNEKKKTFSYSGEKTAVKVATNETICKF